MPNILYVGTCVKNDQVCSDQPQYCGETGKTAEERFVGHHNTIVQLCHQGSPLPVGEHFQGPGHSISDFRSNPVEKIHSKNIFVRKARERHMINKFNFIEHGLNRKLYKYCFPLLSSTIFSCKGAKNANCNLI